MDGGLITIPIQRGYQPRNYYVPPPTKQPPPQMQKPVNYQPQQNAIQPQQIPMDPNKDPGQAGGQVVMFDGKRMRKAVHRKTVDYNSAVIQYLENRCWQRDYRDARAIMPDSLYQIDLAPPMSMLTNPMNCVTTKFIRTSTNKFRCPIFCLAWTPEGRRLVTGASSGEFTLWNGLTFNFETILQAHDTSVRAMVWSNSDSWMVTGDHSGFIKYWQSNMNNVKMFQGHKEPVRGIRWDSGRNVTMAMILSIRIQAISVSWLLFYQVFSNILNFHILSVCFQVVQISKVNLFIILTIPVCTKQYGEAVT